jgi:hypothetical protein
MDTQPEIAASPIGMHYHVCESCAEVFTAETTENPYPEDEDTVVQTLYADIPIFCGCDGSVGREDKMCPDCTELLSDNYYEDRDDEIHFADPGGNSALRAEHGVQNGLCIKCDGAVDDTDSYCRHCGAHLNQRGFPCPSCRAEKVLTLEDVHLGYVCDTCADRNERDCD